MHISCPKCHFKRNVDRKQIPAAAIMATCPKCENKFRFRDPETGDFLEEICSVFEEARDTSIQDSTPSQGSSANDEFLKNSADVNKKDDGQEEIEENSPADDTLEADGVQTQQNKQNQQTQQTQQNKQNKQDQQDKDDNAKSVDSLPYISDDEDPSPLKEEDITNKYDEEDRNNPLLDFYGDSPSIEKEKYQMVTDDVPWEHPERYGIIGSLFQTIVRVMFRAPGFFSTIHSQSSALRPITFYALLGLFQALCLQIWISTFADVEAVFSNPIIQESISQFSTPMTLIISPFLSVFQLLLFSAFFYLAIRITNPEHANYNLIIRIISYAYAPTVLSIVPYIGPLIGLIWFVFNIFVGVKYALRLTWQRTVLALSPIFLLWLFIIASTLSQHGIV